MSWDGKFKYEPMSPDKVKLIMEAYKNEQVYNYILELYELIHYQKEMINKQRLEIIGLIHKQSWKRYDLPEESFKVNIDKPPKSGNMSC
jgi:hypothetical protein